MWLYIRLLNFYIYENVYQEHLVFLITQYLPFNGMLFRRKFLLFRI